MHAVLQLTLVAAAAGCGGDDGGGPSPPGAQIGRVGYISAGDYSTCVTNDLQDGFCWGANSHGQLGDGTHETRLVPVPVSGNLKFSGINAGDHACGVTVDGEDFCWGKGSSGELGNGTTTSSDVPVLVSGGFIFDQINVGSSSCGFRFAAGVYCWGPNDSGQLGTGDFTDRSTPTVVTVTSCSHDSAWIRALPVGPPATEPDIAGATGTMGSWATEASVS